MLIASLSSRFPSLVALAAVVTLFSASVRADGPKDDTAKAINELLAASWKAHNLKPADRASDQEFLRRATLDLLGRIATVDEVRAFQKDTAADKRAKLIDRLLASDEFAANEARIWAVLLVGRSGTPSAREPLERWLGTQIAKNQGWDKIVTALLTASGKASDNGAAAYLAANLGDPLPEQKRAEEGQFDMVGLTLKTLRLFLGYRLQNNPQHPAHPDWQLKHFWGINTFFRQLERANDGAIADNPKLNAENYIVYENSQGLLFSAPPRFLDGRKAEDGKGSRRQQLAAMLVAHDNFARSYVNRVWGQLFGRGLTEQPQVDDFGSHNKVVHAELLERLAKDFVAGGHDTRKLVRGICNSDAYQLSSVANETNAKREAAPYFSRMALKIMSPEQLCESLVVATQARTILNKDELARLRQDSLKTFMTTPGNYESDELSFGDNLLPAISMINNRTINDLIFHKDGTVAKAIAGAKEPQQIIEVLYLAALNRAANAKENERIQHIVNDAATKKEDKGLTALWQDLFWALINSNEFILNH